MLLLSTMVMYWFESSSRCYVECSNVLTDVMTNSQKITQIQQEITVLKSKMHEYYPGRLSSEDIEDVSDRYQEMLEYNEYCDEQREIISALQEDIVALQSLHPSHTYNDPAIAEIEWPIVGSDGLRYVSAEVGYVDQDEEYR